VTPGLGIRCSILLSYGRIDRRHCIPQLRGRKQKHRIPQESRAGHSRRNERTKGPELGGDAERGSILLSYGRVVAADCSLPKMILKPQAPDSVGIRAGQAAKAGRFSRSERSAGDEGVAVFAEQKKRHRNAVARAA
jgi:hypothetical protein